MCSQAIRSSQPEVCVGEVHSPGVKLVNDALEANDSEQPGAETGQPRQEQDGERQQGLPPGRLRQAAGQTSASCAGVAASFHHRRAAAPVAGVRRSGVERRFVFAVGNRVMFRHIPRRSRRGEQTKRAIWYHTGKRAPLLPILCHAPLPKPLAPPSLHAPHLPKHQLRLQTFEPYFPKPVK